MSRPKLLLADDSITIRKVVELTFADEGIDVTAVGNGEEAMQKFIEVQPDIVLVDVNMPGPTGYHICEMIKNDEATRDIPVLLLVGSFEPFDHDEAERVRADGFMIKPFQSIRDLVSKVAELLGTDNESVVHTPEASDIESIVVTPETSDIESLYHNSFSNTYKVTGAETSDIFLGNAGMDDEIIETAHPSDDRLGSVPPHFPEAEETIRGFDWSAEPAEEPLAEPWDGTLGELANELPVEPIAESMGDPFSEPWEEPLAETANEPLDDSGDKPFSALWEEPHAGVASEPEPIAEVSRSFEPRFIIEDDEVLDLPDDQDDIDFEKIDTLRDMEIDLPTEDQPGIQEPSEEFIALIARRVVEKLSDKVVREIAQEAVPRIAEDLIREALEEENKG